MIRLDLTKLRFCHYYVALVLLVAVALHPGWLRAAPSAEFVSAMGRSLVVEGKPYRFKAICFSNSYIWDRFSPQQIAVHHGEIDFRRVKGMGFNSIRFGINGNWYEQDPKAFFTWLDNEILWASKYKIKLILDLHVPIASFWLDPTGGKVNFDIWENEAVAQRNIDFWQAVAKRYSENTTIAGYDLLNEPVTTDQDGKQWQRLAAKMIDAIRQYDQNHLIIVERLYGVEKQYGVKNATPQFLVDDKNVLYDFHFYEPIAYTHQGASWLAKPLGEGGKYPDKNELTPTGLQKLNVSARISSTRVAEGDTDWTTYKSAPITLTESKVIAGAPQIAMHGALSGDVVFDDIEVIETDKDGRQRTVLTETFNEISVWQWYDWQKQSSDSVSFTQNDSYGFADSHSLTMQAVNSPASALAGWSSDRSWYKARPGYSYQITGKMKGTGVKYHSEDAFFGFELNYFEPAGENMPVFNARDKAYLAQELARYSAFGETNNVPVSVLETGVVSRAFGASGLGGANWYRDMLALFNEQNLSYALWNYHGDQMGVFQTSIKEFPGDPNYELIDLLIKEQNGNRDWAYSSIEQQNTSRDITGRPHTDYTAPPGGLDPEQVPQFVVIGFDDNTKVAGINWALELFKNKSNPAGVGNESTFDGSPARVSFYMNSAGFKSWIEDDPASLINATKNIALQGHELGNHTESHHADINKLPWEEFLSRVRSLSDTEWRARIAQNDIDLKRIIGVNKVAGFRAPYLAYNQSMMNSLVNMGYRYDTSIEEGYGKQFNGTNFRWPYRMDHGAPGHTESWWGSEANKDAVLLSQARGLWQLPNHVVMVPTDGYAEHYDFKPGMWQRIKNQLPNSIDHKITGFDFNLWVTAKLSKRDVLAILKYNLDLRLQGNRAPFMFGAHSQYYGDSRWADANVTSATVVEMREAIKEFIDYALSKPVVRIRPANDVIDWIEKPVPLLP